ncbi:hypothetical protein [Streptomyces sp. NRRL F-2664]|uniref:hypothetical protein n=1 Tax=Streptomyces sp. NRRL F-2664 TaxID=1463842 RepID=UPI0004C5F169|nr:hypothetical protein [Streptomyces sp. NRRL F-2664]
MKFNQRASAAAIAVVAATSLLSACAGGTPSATSAEPVAGDRPLVDRAKWPKATPERGLARGLTLPLESYMQTFEETVVLDGAVRRLQEQCMADYGLPVQLPVEGTNPPPSDNDANMERRYGLTDRDAAAVHGYGLPDEAAEPVRQKVPQLEPAEFEVLTGRKLPAAAANGAPQQSPERARDAYNGKKLHEGGCTNWAARQIAKPSQDDLTFVSELNGTSFTESMKLPAVTKALGAWAQCMDAKGHKGLTTPFDAADRVPHVQGRPSPEEIAIAVAEVDCKSQTGLVDVWFKEESRLQTALIAQHLGTLDPIRSRNGAALNAAGGKAGR